MVTYVCSCSIVVVIIIIIICSCCCRRLLLFTLLLLYHSIIILMTFLYVDNVIAVWCVHVVKTLGHFVKKPGGAIG